MRQQDVFKKIGNILQELNEQYDYLKTQTDNIDDLELELFAANANFLSDHLEVLRKLNLHLTKSLPPHQPTVENPQAEPVFQLNQPEQVVEPPVAFTEEVPQQEDEPLAEAPTLEEYYDIEEPAGEDHGVTSPEFVFNFNKEAGPQEEQDLAAEPQYQLVSEDAEEAYTEPEYHFTEPEQTIETYEPPYQPEEPVTTFEEREVNEEETKAEETYLFHTDTEETVPEVDEEASKLEETYSFHTATEEATPEVEEEAPKTAHTYSFETETEEILSDIDQSEQVVEEEDAPEQEPVHFSFEIPTEPETETEINIEPETGRDTFSFIRTEPEVIRHELTLDEADAFASDDEDQDGTINTAYRHAQEEEQKPQHTPLQEQTFAEPEPDAPETMITPEAEQELKEEPTLFASFTPTPEPASESPVFTPTPEPLPTYQLHRQPEPEPTPAPEPERPLTLNERISAQLANNAAAASASQPIKDLKGAITLNDKMLFVRDLFNGYSLAYSEAIEILNRFNNFEDAERFLNSNYVEKNRWAEKPATTEKFFDLLRRRFA